MEEREGRPPHAQCKQRSLSPFQLRIDKILVCRFQQNWWVTYGKKLSRKENSSSPSERRTFQSIYAVSGDLHACSAQIVIHWCLQETEQMVLPAKYIPFPPAGSRTTGSPGRGLFHEPQNSNNLLSQNRGSATSLCIDRRKFRQDLEMSLERKCMPVVSSKELIRIQRMCCRRFRRI